MIFLTIIYPLATPRLPVVQLTPPAVPPLVKESALTFPRYKPPAKLGERAYVLEEGGKGEKTE